MGNFNWFKNFLSKLIRDNNDINEKTVLGFASFLVLVTTLIIDIITGLMGKDFPIHQFIFDGFLIMTIGSLGIASVDKYINKNNKSDKDSEGTDM